MPEAGAAPPNATSSGHTSFAPDVATKESCIKHVDAIWFCYSPVFQTTVYYREGKFDSCLGKWGDLWDCIKLRTAAAPAVIAKREALRKAEEEVAKSYAPIWETRTPTESADFWHAEFQQQQQPN